MTNRTLPRSRASFVVLLKFVTLDLVVPPDANPPIRTRHVKTSIPMLSTCRSSLSYGVAYYIVNYKNHDISHSL